MRSFIRLTRFTPLIFSALVLSALTAAPAGASPQGGLTQGSGSSFLDTDTFRCVIREFRPNGAVKVEQPDGRVHYLNLTRKVPIRARHKEDFDGRKKLRLSDLRVGQRLEVTHVKNTDAVLRIKVLRPKKKDEGHTGGDADRSPEDGG